MAAMNLPLEASKKADSVDSMGKPAHSMWHYRPTRLYSQTVSEASQSLQTDAVEFNKAADAVAAAAANDTTDVLLTADIGGTNCRFNLWAAKAGLDTQYEEIFNKIYPTKDYPTFEDAFDSLCQEEVYQQHPPESAALACAGPVVDNICDMTNLSWVIDGDSLTKKYGLRVAVLNDFEAAGYGVTVLAETDYIALNDVTPTPKGPKAVLGPGTGLGEAQLIWDDSFEGYKCWPSEGAHATFAPRGSLQRALAHYVEDKFGYAEVEHVACGSGLQNIYDFLRTVNPHKADYTREQRHAERDPPSIGKAALQEGDQLCLDAVDIFLGVLGAEAGQMGLRLLASGGVYMTGGIIPKMMERVKDGGLLEAYMYKTSKFHNLVKTFPLYAVTHEKLGILGTREYALRLLKTPEVTKGYRVVVESARHGDLFRHGTI